MSYPVLWWKSPFFYPIGNTPPACLTQDLAPEENAQILLLGCGDPRHILHTIHASLGDVNRTLDFTCCDLETAVLARNILLMTMIADGISWHHTWRIFYHFYLDSESRQVLFSQCRTLRQASADLATWNASKYGKYLRFCTEQSMIEIRGHWGLYLSIDMLSELQKKALQDSFTSSMKGTLQKNADDYTGLMASGPLISFASKELFRSFWSTGVTKGRIPPPPACLINPMFAYSLGGREFNVHYATEPVSAFHLAPALALSQRSAVPTSAEDLVDAAMTQFSNWCKSFQLQVNKIDPLITIRFVAGDCLLVCKALRKCNTTRLTKTGIHARPWGLSQIEFTTDYSELESSSAPTIFNIIDTSNLADHIGLLNILLVTVPLLQPRPWSILHTNTLQDPHGSVTAALSEKLFADIPTLSLFLGVAPVPALSYFTSHSPINGSRFMSWKYPSSLIANTSLPQLDVDRRVLVCDELQLGKFFYSVYTQMFAEEDVRGHTMNPTPASLRRQNIVRYIRASFVEFLSFVRRRVCVDWTKAFTCFLRLGDADKKLFFGHRQSYQDLTYQLYLTNLASHNDLRWSFLRDVRSSGDPFEGWDSVPPVVSVTLKVPRESLKIMEDINRTELGIPILFCMTAGIRGENMHSSIRPTFGNAVVAGHHQNAQVVIREDEAGWQGTSPLIVSFDSPSWIFTKAADMKRISLNARSTPHNARLLSRKLGNIELRIFTTLVTDNNHVWITRFRPNESHDICRLDSDESPGLVGTNAGKKDTINVDFHAPARANSLTLRHTIEDQGAAKNLANGLPVSAKAVADTVVLVSFQGYEQPFRFPFPINGEKITTRIARKSSYIEVVAPIRRDPENSVGSFMNPFPIARTRTSFNLLNIRYINLSKMPTLDLSVSKEKLLWLSIHLGLSLSDQERNSKAIDVNHRVAADLKKGISTIFLGSSGIEKRSTVFELSNPTVGVYAVVVVNALGLDLSESQTVVADACVIPVNEKNRPKVMATLRRGWATTIHTPDDVMEAWKVLLPTLAERCRTWQHSDRCEYRTRGIPACNEGSFQDKHASPLCKCGFGKDLGTFSSLAAWQEIQSEATRVAIAPLFPFFLPESISGNVDKVMERLQRPKPTMTACGHCSGPGQPILLTCGRCKKITYCSQKCQKAHWRTHKPECIT